MFLKKQRNELYRILVDNNLNSVDFTEEITVDRYVLRRNASSFLFFINRGNTYHKIGFSPIVELNQGDIDVGVTWEEAKPYIMQWADILNEEYNTPDLWAEAKANSKLFAINSGAPNEMFSGAELRQLEGQVRQLVQGLAALALPIHAQEQLTETVQEIPDKATRFTKKELEGWFMGAFISQVTNLALSPEHVAAIGHLLKTTFMGLLQLH